MASLAADRFVSSAKPKLCASSSLLQLRNPNSVLPTSIAPRRRQFPGAVTLSRPLRAVVSPSAAPIEHDAGEEECSLRRICTGRVPDHVLCRMEEVGYITPTDVQREALPALFSRKDCILHAQTGSGKTLAYLLLILSVLDPGRSGVQALIIVPTRELGIQVTKVARLLAARSYTVMALLDGGRLRRHKVWLEAKPPEIVVATIRSLCQMLEKQVFRLDDLQVLVINEVDFLFNSSEELSYIRKLMTQYSSSYLHQTILASASIPLPSRFIHNCIQKRWTKADVLHIHVNKANPFPSSLNHRFTICHKSKRHETLLSLLEFDSPESGIIFVGKQSEKSKKAGNPPPLTHLLEFLRSSYQCSSDILVLEEDMSINYRAAALSEIRQKGSYLLVATDIAARGLDLPETTHIYNFDLPRTAVDYLHRAGRTGRKPFSGKKCFVTSILTSEERFVLLRYENEWMFEREEIFL